MARTDIDAVTRVRLRGCEVMGVPRPPGGPATDLPSCPLSGMAAGVHARPAVHPGRPRTRRTSSHRQPVGVRAQARLEAIGRAYIDFARTEPGWFRTAFASARLHPADSPRRTRRRRRNDTPMPPWSRVRGLVRCSRPVQPAPRWAAARPTRTPGRVRDHHRPGRDLSRTSMTRT